MNLSQFLVILSVVVMQFCQSSRCAPLHNTTDGVSINFHSSNDPPQSVSEFEFIKENLVDSQSDSVEGGSMIKPKVKPPLFMKRLYDKLEDQTNSPLSLAPGHFLRAWLPIEISNDESNTTFVHFQQTKNRDHGNFGNFLKAQIILSLKDDIQFAFNKMRLVLTTQLPGENTTHKPINITRRQFYKIDITDFLNKKMPEKVVRPVPIFVSFMVVSEDGNTSFLGDLFDVQVEQPFILLCYQNVPESFFSLSDERKNSREKRYWGLYSIIIEGMFILLSMQSLMELFGCFHVEYRRLSRSVNQTVAVAENEAVAATESLLAPNNATALLNSTVLLEGNDTVRPSISNEFPQRNCCRRHELLATYIEVQWPNVISPQMFDLGFCSGICTYPLENEYFNYTVHSLLMDRYRMHKGFDIPSNVPHSTCVPTEYKDVSVMTEEEDGGFELKIYHKVTVTTCGCR